MSYEDNLNDNPIPSILRRLRILETTAPVGFTSISRGALRVASNEGLLVQGSQKVEGWLVVTGTERVTGLLEVLGTLSVAGQMNVTGPLNTSGEMNVNGPLKVSGAATLGAILTLAAGGKILGGGMTIEGGKVKFDTGASLEADGGGARLISGGSGPRAYVFPGSAGMQFDPSRGVQVNGTGTHVAGMLWADGGLQTQGSKNFIMNHPLKPGHWLRHGSTESPVSGIEYWGAVELDRSGRAVVDLPDYFEELAKPAGRTVLVTGRGFAADWTDITDGSFEIAGSPGGRASWLVKAERFGGDFLLEEPQFEAEDLASSS